MPFKYKRVLLKFSGEALLKENLDSLKNLVEDIKELVDNNIQIGIVIGGGNIFRGINSKEFGMDRYMADHIGMMATCINAISFSEYLKNNSIKSKILTMLKIGNILEPFTKEKTLKYFENGFVTIFCGGTGNPYFTTDSGASLKAIEIEADVLFKATKVNGVYEEDPLKNPKAKFYNCLNYSDLLYKNLKVIDSTAISLARENNLPILIFNMFHKGNIQKAVKGESVGTIIS